MGPFHWQDVRVASFAGVTTATAVIPGVEDKKILILGGAMSMATAGTVTLTSDVPETGDPDPVTVMPALALGAGVPLTLTPSDLAYFRVTADHEVILTATQATAGFLLYVLRPS